MNKFEDYAKEIVSKLPDAPKPKSEESGSSTIWHRHAEAEGELIEVNQRDSDLLVSEIQKENIAKDKIIGNIMNDTFDDEDRDAVTRGVWENGAESLAYYKSYHFLNRAPYPGKWGIFIYSFGINAITDDIGHYYPGKFTQAECVKIALQFLHRHERFHWHIDAWTMSHEAIQNSPLYENYINFVYRVVYPSCALEEALANNHALRSMQRAGITEFMHDFMSLQPGAYSKYAEDRNKLKSGVATQILDGCSDKGLQCKSGYPLRPDQVPWIAQGSKSLLWDGHCPVYIISGIRSAQIVPPNVGAPGLRENRDFVARYLGGVLDSVTDHEYYRIDNGEKLKLPNNHGKADRLKPWEFDNILAKAGMRTPEYSKERMRTNVWKKNTPRPAPKPPRV